MNLSSFEDMGDLSNRYARSVAAIMAIPDGEKDGTISCPSCGRPLHYAFTAMGRLKAHCETPNCTSVS